MHLKLFEKLARMTYSVTGYLYHVTLMYIVQREDKTECRTVEAYNNLPVLWHHYYIAKIPFPLDVRLIIV